jgi:hypothetical protein
MEYPLGNEKNAAVQSFPWTAARKTGNFAENQGSRVTSSDPPGDDAWPASPQPLVGAGSIPRSRGDQGETSRGAFRPPRKVVALSSSFDVVVSKSAYSRVQLVAGSIGHDPFRVLGALIYLWQKPAAEDTDVVSVAELTALFGPGAIPALVDVGRFLAPVGEGLYRIRGAARRYGDRREACRRGAEKTNAKRWGQPQSEAENRHSVAIATPQRRYSDQPDNRPELQDEKWHDPCASVSMLCYVNKSLISHSTDPESRARPPNEAPVDPDPDPLLTFGADAGLHVSEMRSSTVDWYAYALSDRIMDPRYRRFEAANRNLCDAIVAEANRRGLRNGPRPGLHASRWRRPDVNDGYPEMRS